MKYIRVKKKQLLDISMNDKKIIYQVLGIVHDVLPDVRAFLDDFLRELPVRVGILDAHDGHESGRGRCSHELFP